MFHIIQKYYNKKRLITNLKNLDKSLVWCRWPESNRHEWLARRILSPVRLPVPPHLHFKNWQLSYDIDYYNMDTIICQYFLKKNSFVVDEIWRYNTINLKWKKFIKKVILYKLINIYIIYFSLKLNVKLK